MTRPVVAGLHGGLGEPGAGACGPSALAGSGPAGLGVDAVGHLDGLWRLASRLIERLGCGVAGAAAGLAVVPAPAVAGGAEPLAGGGVVELSAALVAGGHADDGTGAVGGAWSARGRVRR